MHNKYRNTKVKFYGMEFDSKAEGERYLILRQMERQGKIQDLRRQVPFELIPAQKGKNRNERSCEYIADFTYLQDGEMIVEDVKSDITRKLPEYIMKRKLMLYIHHLSISEVKNR